MTRTSVAKSSKKTIKAPPPKATKAVKPRKTKDASASYLDEKFTGPEPVWDTERAKNFSDEEFDAFLRRSFTYYNYYFSVKDLKRHVVQWVEDNTKLTVEQKRRYALSPPDRTPMTVCSLVRAISKGMPLRDKHRKYIIDSVLLAIEARVEHSAVSVAKDDVPAIKKVAAPTIQDRLAEKTNEVIAEIEGEVDNVFTNLPPALKVYDFLTSRNVPQSQVGKIRDVFQRQINELADFEDGIDEQLNEAYAHLGKADMRRITDFYVNLINDLDSYTMVKKAAKKIRVKKAPSKEKVVAKVKYMRESKELKLVSISPVDILGAQECWVYHTKYRKLGRYVAEDHNSLGIKGTSVVGFDANKSVAKTLRKPAEQLKDFMKAGKVQLRTYLKDIKATETKLNGRLNADILLLKVA